MWSEYGTYFLCWSFVWSLFGFCSIGFRFLKVDSLKNSIKNWFMISLAEMVKTVWWVVFAKYYLFAKFHYLLKPLLFSYSLFFNNFRQGLVILSVSPSYCQPTEQKLKVENMEFRLIQLVSFTFFFLSG